MFRRGVLEPAASATERLRPRWVQTCCVFAHGICNQTLFRAIIRGLVRRRRRDCPSPPDWWLPTNTGGDVQKLRNTSLNSVYPPLTGNHQVFCGTSQSSQIYFRENHTLRVAASWLVSPQTAFPRHSTPKEDSRINTPKPQRDKPWRATVTMVVNLWLGESDRDFNNVLCAGRWRW